MTKSLTHDEIIKKIQMSSSLLMEVANDPDLMDAEYVVIKDLVAKVQQLEDYFQEIRE